MSQLEMTTEEAELVRSMLRNHLATLDMEIDHTDHRDFKRMLLARRDKVASLLERCSAPADGARQRETSESH